MKKKENENNLKIKINKSSLSLKDKLIDIINNSLPIEALKDIPTILTSFIVIITYSLLLSLFLFSIIYSYNTLRNELFLSLDRNAGSCRVVSKTINGGFMADINGNWEGNKNFEYRSAIYSGTLINFDGNEHDFNSMLQSVFDIVDIVANESYYLDLAENLVVWMAASVNINVNDQIHKLQFTGDPKIVFNSMYSYASMRNEQGICDVPSSISYDRSVGIFTISYPIVQFLASTSCMSIINPYHFGYTGVGTEFIIRIDMQSAITAIGVNTGIIKINDLEKVPYTESYFTTNNINYESNYYFYPRYPGMTPLQCVNLTSDKIVCALSYGSVYVYPVFNHFGGSLDEPMKCDCESGTGYLPRCSYFNLLPGLIFYDYLTDGSSSYNDLVILITQTNSGRKLNRDAYNISSSTILRTYSPTSDWLKESFKFCTQNTSRGCSVLSIATTNPPLYTVSPYYYQVKYIILILFIICNL